MAKRLVVSFPDSRNPSLEVGVVGIGTFDDDTTQFEMVMRFAEWARGELFGRENRRHLEGSGAICLRLKPTESGDEDATSV